MDIRGICPLVQVFDMSTAIRFYRDVLGFRVHSTSEPGDNCNWAWLKLNGAAAAERLVKILPGGRPLGCLFALPCARPVADRVYRLIARNRFRLGCGAHCVRPGR